MKKFATILAGAGLVFFSGVGSAYAWMKNRQPTSHVQSRTKAILSHARQGHARVILLGDSISELALVPQLCGQDTLNAGLAGANVAQVEDLAKALLPARKADLVLIAVGVNDALSTGATGSAAFTASCRRIIDLAKQTGARVVAVNVEPVVKGNAIFDADRIAEENRIIGGLGVRTIDLWSAMRQPGTAWLPASYSDDGTHPNLLGYDHWKAAIGTACQA